MKWISKVLLLLIAVLLNTGCAMKENIKMTISSNKNMKISIITAMDNEMIDTMISMKETGDMSGDNTKEYTDKERWEFLENDDETLEKPDGYDLKKYDENGFKGYVATKNLGNIDKLSTTEAIERKNIFDDDDESILTGNLFIKNGNEYTSNMTIDLGDDETEMSSYESYGAAFDLKLIIELPTRPISHNAQEVSADGKTLTWDLLKTKDVDLKFDFKKSGPKPSSTTTIDDIRNEGNKIERNNFKMFLIAAIIGVIFFVGVIVVIVIIVILSSKKNKEPEPATIIQDTTTSTVIEETNQTEENKNITKDETIEEGKPEKEEPVTEIKPEDNNSKEESNNNDQEKVD